LPPETDLCVRDGPLGTQIMLKSVTGQQSTHRIVHGLSQGLVDAVLIGIRDCEAEVETSFSNLGLVGVANVTHLSRGANETAVA
jgi:hypothetical protein